MARELIPQEEVWQALDDALARAHEFDGAPFEEKMAAFGLDAEEVMLLATARYESMPHDTPAAAFAHGFIEGLLTGHVLGDRA